MDKSKIRNFAVNARERLLTGVRQRLASLGIDDQGVKAELEISTANVKYYTNENFPVQGAEIEQRNQVVQHLQRMHQENDDWQAVLADFIEEVAYTWFNRIIALRFMEVNDYLPSRVRVLSSEEGWVEPDIINHALEIEDDLGGFTPDEREQISHAQLTKNPRELDTVYTMLFIKQTDALADILPGLFEKTAAYLKLLFTPKYNDGVIKALITEIPEADFDVEQSGQVEIIGWMYQYYNSVPKDEVMAMPRSVKYRASQIARATQIFTPDWIVKYMVQNSLGKYWINILRARSGETEEHLVRKFDWNYYMIDSPQTEEVSLKVDDANKQLESTCIEDIKVIDPAMGSGHILVYIFDLLMDIYISEGYSRSQAAKSILENNLYGLDVDTRAYQLAYFSVMMKYRQYNRRAFRQETSLRIYDIPSTGSLLKQVNTLKYYFDNNRVENLARLVEIFVYGNDIGSLLDVTNIDLNDINQMCLDEQIQNSFELQHIFEHVRNLLNIARLLSSKYDIVIANPPYMGSARMNKVLSKFAKKKYPRSKSDLFAMFIEHWNELVKSYGYNAMVTMQSWMFLSSYAEMRTHLLNTITVSNLMHMENNVMGIAFGTAVGIYRKINWPDFKGTYHQIKTEDIANQDPERLPISGNRFNQIPQSNFTKIPGSPVAYWAPASLIKDFDEGTPLGEVVDAKQGLATADNNRFLRYWYEVDFNRIKFDAQSTEDAKNSGKKWFPYNKGGAYRKWYGNYDYVVNWENDGDEIKHFTDVRGKLRSRPQNTDYYFKEAVTWPLITSGDFSMRFRDHGSIHDEVRHNC